MANGVPDTNARNRPPSDSADGRLETSSAAADSLPAANEGVDADAPPAQSESLEQQKLRAEIDEIRLRIRDQSSSNWQSWAKGAIKYVAIVVPLGVGLVGLLIQWNEHQDRRERLARFEVGPEVMQLATQLDRISTWTAKASCPY